MLRVFAWGGGVRSLGFQTRRGFAATMTDKVVISCAVTGSADTVFIPDPSKPLLEQKVPKGKSPLVPYTPEQIADSALKAAKAGASVVHLHVRDPKTGAMAHDVDLYTEVVERIRGEKDVNVMINLTCGMGGDFVPDPKDPNKGLPGTDLRTAEKRVEHAVKLKPDICSFDCGSLNYMGTCYIAPDYMLRETAKLMKDAGVKPEVECFELGHINFAKRLWKDGLLPDDALYQLCLGIPWASEPYPETLLHMRNMLPPHALWSAFSISRHQMPIAAQTVLAGGHVRVGLEDNLYLGKGNFVTNEDLVRHAKNLIESLGAKVATPDEARAILNCPRK